MLFSGEDLPLLLPELVWPKLFQTERLGWAPSGPPASVSSGLSWA